MNTTPSNVCSSFLIFHNLANKDRSRILECMFIFQRGNNIVGNPCPVCRDEYLVLDAEVRESFLYYEVSKIVYVNCYVKNYCQLSSK